MAADGVQRGGGGHWLADATPDFRRQVLHKIVKELAELYGSSQQLCSIATQFEGTVFRQSNNMEDYLSRISRKISYLRQNRKLVVQAASAFQQQVQMGHQAGPSNAVHDIQGGNSSVAVGSIPPTLLQSQIIINQQSSLPCQNPQTSGTTGCAKEVDWREEMFQKITSLKEAYFSELTEFDRTFVFQERTTEQLDSLPPEQADKYRAAQKVKGMTRNMLRFLQLQKNNLSEGMKEQFTKYPIALRDLLHYFRGRKARIEERNTGRHQSQNCRQPPQIIDLTGDTAPHIVGEGSQQKHQEQPAHESSSQSRQIIATTPPLALHEKQQKQPADGRIPQMIQIVPSATPLGQQQNNKDHMASQAEDDEVRCGAEAPVAKKNPIDRLIDASKSLSPAVLRSLAADMGLKRAFHCTTSGSMGGSFVSFESDALESESNGESSYKKRRMPNGNEALLEEINAANSMLIDTVIRISNDQGADGITIEFCYSPVSLSPGLMSVINTSEMSTKLFISADYPRSSPVLDGDQGDDLPRKKLRGISGAADMTFRRALRILRDPSSIKEMAWAWDSCMRTAVLDFVHRHGGGTFSSRYSRWESCVAA